MSDLSNVTELLEQECFCHDSELPYMFECMPPSIKQPRLRQVDDHCYHAQEKEIKKTLGEFKTFLETKGKFKVGDRVELNYTPTINEKVAWGWLSSRHFLIKGAQAVVNEISYYGNEFGYSIIFDEDSWIDEKNVVHPRDSEYKHTYYFRESGLEKIGTTPLNCEFLRKLWSDFYKIGD